MYNELQLHIHTCKYQVCKSLACAPILEKLSFTDSSASQHDCSTCTRISPVLGAVATRHFVYNNKAKIKIILILFTCRLTLSAEGYIIETKGDNLTFCVI